MFSPQGVIHVIFDEQWYCEESLRNLTAHMFCGVNMRLHYMKYDKNLAAHTASFCLPYLATGHLRLKEKMQEKRDTLCILQKNDISDGL